MSRPMDRPGDNRASLVRSVVAGRVAPARFHAETLSHDRTGRLALLPGTGGISLGVHAGDPVDRWRADHLMVGASIEDDAADPAVPGNLHLLSCIGNAVRDTSGDPLGVVAGKRGGLAPGYFAPNLVSVELPDSRAEHLNPGDRVIVEAYGRGLEFPQRPEIGLYNLSPRLLDDLPISDRGGRLVVDVRMAVPPRFAGAGLGSDAWVGDLEIVAAETFRDRLGRLRFGDLVAFESIDARASRSYRPGFVSIGLVAHGPSPAPGHGIGLTLLMSGPTGSLEPRPSEEAGVGPTLRRWAESSR